MWTREKKQNRSIKIVPLCWLFANVCPFLEWQQSCVERISEVERKKKERKEKKGEGNKKLNKYHCCSCELRTQKKRVIEKLKRSRLWYKKKKNEKNIQHMSILTMNTLLIVGASSSSLFFSFLFSLSTHKFRYIHLKPMI